jgi:formamidopyrimidine-DNA glycosylase
MPELPEVETTATALRPYLEGKTLTAVATSGQKLRQAVPNLSGLKGCKVKAIRRRAKYMLLELDNKQTLVIHLGMSGRMKAETTPFTKLEKHQHMALSTAEGHVMLHDPRRFGLILLLKTADVDKHSLFKALGPEPFSATFTAKHLQTALAKRTSLALKPALMDAKVVVGVGNIYASEALFDAKLSPLRKASSLTAKQAGQLVKSIRFVLNKAIKAGGSSLRDYAHPTGTLGNFQHQFCVYSRKGQPCPRCQTPIRQITQAQRSTFYCPTCQK